MLITSMPLYLLAAEDSSGVGGYSSPGFKPTVQKPWIKISENDSYRLTLYRADTKKDMNKGKATKIGKSVLYPAKGKTVPTDAATSGKSVFEYHGGEKQPTKLLKIKNNLAYRIPLDAETKAQELFMQGFKDEEGKSEYIKSKMLTFENATGWTDEYIAGIFGEKAKYKGLIELAGDAGNASAVVNEDGTIKKGFFKVYIEPVMAFKDGTISTYKDLTSKQEFDAWKGNKKLAMSMKDLIYWQASLYSAYNDLNAATVPGLLSWAVSGTANAIHLSKPQKEINMVAHTGGLISNTDPLKIKQLMQPYSKGAKIPASERAFDSMGVGIYEIKQDEGKPIEDRPNQFDIYYYEEKLEKDKKNQCDGGWDKEKQIWNICEPEDEGYTYVEYCVTESDNPLGKSPQDLKTPHPDCKTVPRKDRPPVPLKPNENIIVKWKKDKPKKEEQETRNYKFTVPEWRLNRYVKDMDIA
ncbi:hypothetical protein KQI68_01460 [Peptoniphilus sp. MSJ-1]|uniref:Uncharacterized protein n=1 Tax=Peptoniphilus ovalis TaxID=2841503 RepID=A0ABS6FE88_9FIRM|nr:hypothetical protein [Peptoniphilus ovalis]MBU5668499.1 hypothetical protein [Peptoniphilus ovalis]